MGGGHYVEGTYNTLSKTRGYATKSVNETFSKSLKDTMDPSQFKNNMRECRDSDDHPYSVPVLIFLDVTGSMGHIPHTLIKDKFPILMDTLIKNNVVDAQICFGAIGDHNYDDVPLQMGQFEQETTKLADMLESIYIEGGGGGNAGESYGLGWYVAAAHTSLDCFEKRGTKGFLFTIGDENILPKYEGRDLKKIMNLPEEPSDYTKEQLYDMVSNQYHVFHIHVQDGSYSSKDVERSWKPILNERFLVLEDSNNIAELIATTVSVINGAEMENILATFDTETSKDVTNALALLNTNLKPAVQNNDNANVIKL
jgi:hypothetical protein